MSIKLLIAAIAATCIMAAGLLHMAAAGSAMAGIELSPRVADLLHMGALALFGVLFGNGLPTRS